MRGATCVIAQTHQILRLPRKVTLIIDTLHTWNVIYNARSNKCHCPNSPNTSPATQNDSHDQSSSHMKRYLQCAEEQVSLSNFTKYCACHEKWSSWLILDTNETLFTMRGTTCIIVQTHQILRLPRKMTVPNLKEIGWKRMKRHFQCAADPRMIRPWSEHDPTMIRPWNRQSATRLATEVTFHAHHEHFVLKNTTFRAPAIIPNFTEYCACHEKWHSNFTKYCACHAKWLSWSILFTHEMLVTMRGVTSVIVQLHQILRLPRKMNLMIHPWHKWNVIFTMREATCVIVQTHQILRLPRKMTVQNLKEIGWKRMKRHFQCAADPTMIREWSDHETVSPQPASQPRLPFTPTTSILYWKMQHFALRLSFQISPNTAPATKSDTRTSPNTAPATKNESHDWSLSHMKRYLQCAEQQVSLSKLTKYCACHEKWISWLIQTHQMLRLPRKVTLQLHQILRLPLSYDLTTPITWRHLLLDDTYYWTTLLDDTYYLTTPNTWRHYLTTPHTWRHCLTTPTTWRHYLTTPILDDT